jgi:hypothetical protein
MCLVEDALPWGNCEHNALFWDIQSQQTFFPDNVFWNREEQYVSSLLILAGIFLSSSDELE